MFCLIMWKSTISIFLACVFLSYIVFGQTISGDAKISGGEISTGVYGGELKEDLAQGLVASWLGSQQVYMAGTGGSNVFALTDLTGHGYDLKQYLTTNQVVAISSFGTNDIPCIAFNTASGITNCHMKCDSMASLFSGTDKPVTMIFVVNNQFISNSKIDLGFGDSNSTNAACNLMGPRFHGAIGTQTFIHNCSTNAASAAINKTTGTLPSTNSWFIWGVNYSGTNGQVWCNLSAGGNTQLDQAAATFNQFSIGIPRGTNGVRSSTAAGGRFFFGGGNVYSNYLSTTEMTNAMNRLNSRIKTRVF